MRGIVETTATGKVLLVSNMRVVERLEHLMDAR
jgi:hypothetical protein